MTKRNMRGWLALGVGVCLVLAGCDDGNGGDEGDVDVTGTWSGSIHKANETGTGTLVLEQNGTDVTGTETDTWSQRAGVTGTVTGTVDGHTVHLTIVDESVTQITAQVSGDTMTCTWTNNDGDSGTAELERQ